jgi:hypothetical protein
MLSFVHQMSQKDLIAYHKANLTLLPWQKHVEVEHKTLFAKYVEHVANHIKYLAHWEPSNKKTPCYTKHNLWFFSFY